LNLLKPEADINAEYALPTELPLDSVSSSPRTRPPIKPSLQPERPDDVRERVRSLGSEKLLTAGNAELLVRSKAFNASSMAWLVASEKAPIEAASVREAGGNPPKNGEP